MRIEGLTKDRTADFINYCKLYRDQLDDSFLGDEELEKFVPNEENPTYIILDEQDKIVGAASLIINSYYREGKKARFRIFHSSIWEKEPYEMLLSRVSQHTEGLERIIVFIPEENEQLKTIYGKLDFYVERYSFLLERGESEIPEPVFPAEYELKAFQFDRDEQIWCDVRNEAFAKLLGHETPITPNTVKEMKHWDEYLEGGMMILYHKERPVGLVRAAKDFYQNKLYTVIGPLAVIPEYQGLGLGRALLRTGMHYGRSKGYVNSILSVNGENEKAVELYLLEGFKRTQTVVCYIYDLN